MGEAIFYPKNLQGFILNSDYLWLQRISPFHSTSDTQKIMSRTQIWSNKYKQPSKLEGFIM